MGFTKQFDKGRARFLEPGGGEMLVEVDQHYETVEHLVGRMLQAGANLEAARARGFQFPDGQDTGEVDVTRTPGFDLADLSSEARALEARLTAAEAKAKAAAEEKAKADAEAAALAQEKAIREKIAAEAATAQK